MINFDFTAPADVFAFVARGARKRAMTFRKFDTGAEAVHHAIELLDAGGPGGLVIETDDGRFEGTQIRALDEDSGYPLPRAQLRRQ